MQTSLNFVPKLSPTLPLINSLESLNIETSQKSQGLEFIGEHRTYNFTPLVIRVIN